MDAPPISALFDACPGVPRSWDSFAELGEDKRITLAETAKNNGYSHFLDRLELRYRNEVATISAMAGIKDAEPIKMRDLFYPSIGFVCGATWKSGVIRCRLSCYSEIVDVDATKG